MAVAAEIAHSKRLFAERGWPVIDVTRRSIEETAAAIIDFHKEHKMKFIAAGLKWIFHRSFGDCRTRSHLLRQARRGSLFFVLSGSLLRLFRLTLMRDKLNLLCRQK
jgi:hypothetical protein